LYKEDASDKLMAMNVFVKDVICCILESVWGVSLLVSRKVTAWFGPKKVIRNGRQPIVSKNEENRLK
jgi:hypothetical protein